MSLSLEWVLGIVGGFITLNLTIWKIISTKREGKLLKQMEENTDKKLLPFEEKIKTHGKRISDFNIKMESCITEIGNIKVFIAETELNFKHIKESLDELKDKSNKILECANRTRENGLYIEKRKK